MSTIVFRTNAGQNTGLGHVVRCAHLARELTQNGATCLFVLDYIEDGIAPFVSDLNVRTLYDKPQDQLDPHIDSRRFDAIAKEHNPDWVVVDDYRLAEEWETPLRESGCKVCVIDDLLRPHQCDLLIDPKWRGDDTQSRYDALTPPTALKLLGPDYAMLSTHFKNEPPQQNPDTPFTIMIGLGGGGDLSQCERIIDGLLTHQTDFGRAVHLSPVLGPLSTDTASFVQRYETNASVTPIVGETELYPHLCQTDFYIGAAGGVLYQLMALNIPALTFPLSESQHTDLRQLEDIGHFFHLEKWSETDIEKLPNFIRTVIDHYPRVQQMCRTAKVAVDGFGAHRIAQALLGLDRNQPRTTPHSPPHFEEDTELTAHHRIRSVCDQDINHYLISRNLDANCQNMISPDRISFIDHYSWWFNAKRASFLLTKDGTPSLYIWHEVKRYKDQDYLIGGWFVCGELAGFQDVMLALNWQLEHCDGHAPGIPWIAVIHRQNNYVRLLNKYLGFLDVEPDTPYGDAISEIFNGAAVNDFYFVSRDQLIVNQPNN